MKMADAEPLIQKVSPLPIPPFMLNDTFYDSLAENLPVDDNIVQPLPSWTRARKRESGTTMPQSIAHRGFKSNHPENTTGAFKGAVKAGAHAIETDIHMTKDQVIVLSHDATLKRCFGKNEKIVDCTWDYISEQRTLQAPNEPMPRLQDLLEYLASPGLEDIWMLLDIKIDVDANTVMHLIAQTISSIPSNPSKPWNQRIVLGVWAAKYIPLCAKYLPTFPISHIGFSIPYARQFLPVPNISFNMLQKSLIIPYFGHKFICDARAKGRPILTWTVNEVEMMRWCISKGLDGVITDDPKKFLEVCDEWERGKREIKVGWRLWLMILWINFMVVIFGTIFWWRYGWVGKMKMRKEKGRRGGEKGVEVQDEGR